MDISEAFKIKTRKSQGLLLSYTQVNSSNWQIKICLKNYSSNYSYILRPSQNIWTLKAEMKLRHCEKATQFEKKYLIFVLNVFFFKFLWPFQKSWTFHIFLWFPWCLKKPWCNLRYRFLWITSKCRSFWGISNHVFFAVRNQLELMEFFENTTKLLKSVHN